MEYPIKKKGGGGNETWPHARRNDDAVSRLFSHLDTSINKQKQ
jgi:hypothetical protein